jgi:cellulose synthase/poly-beta-1,6-N-acetylglucosamine synthase-like glycosyltransferase
MKKPKVTYDFFPRVSLMVYAWQSGNVIERKIKNFLQLDYPKDLLEIIVFDNHSFYETRSICLKYEKQGLITYFRPKKVFDRIAPVLDRAIKQVAKGDIIALTDPDGLCEQDWLKKIVQPFKDSKVGAVAGVTHCGNYYKNLFTKLRAIEDEWWYHIYTLGKNGKIKISDFQPICGANYALRRKAWESVGQSHGSSLVEDYEMTFKLYNKGWKIASIDAHVWQEEVETVSQYIRQRRRWYSPSIKHLLQGDNKKDKILGAIPISMQTTAFLSLLYFIFILVNPIKWFGILSNKVLLSFPFLFIIITLIYGLWKVKKTTLIKYLPIFIIFDCALQLVIFLETKVRIKKEYKWVKLVKGKYYHTGAQIRMD